MVNSVKNDLKRPRLVAYLKQQEDTGHARRYSERKRTVKDADVGIIDWAAATDLT